MSENESASTDTQTPAASENEEITYQAVEKDGVVTAIREMKGRKHLRTIETRTGNHTLLQGFNQRCIFNQSAPCGIDQQSIAFHHLEFGVAKQVSRFLG